MTRPGHLERRNKTKVKCPHCGQREMARIARRGFWRERILPMLGLYPWQCAICGEEKMLKLRGAVLRRRDRSKDENEATDAAAKHAHQF